MSERDLDDDPRVADLCAVCGVELLDGEMDVCAGCFEAGA